jgi:hypothetical protein
MGARRGLARCRAARDGRGKRRIVPQSCGSGKPAVTPRPFGLLRELRPDLICAAPPRRSQRGAR